MHAEASGKLLLKTVPQLVGRGADPEDCEASAPLFPFPLGVVTPSTARPRNCSRIADPV